MVLKVAVRPISNRWRPSQSHGFLVIIQRLALQVDSSKPPLACRIRHPRYQGNHWRFEENDIIWLVLVKTGPHKLLSF